MINISKENAMTLVDLPNGKRAIGTKWVFRNKKDKRGIIVGNKARLVAQGYTQEEGINYDEVFALVSRIEASRLFLAYASFMRFIVYQMDVKSVFLYATIKEEVYVSQPPGFKDPRLLEKVYKVYVDDIIFGSTKKFLCDEFEQMMYKRFQMSSMRGAHFLLRVTVSTLMEPSKALIKDAEVEDVYVHLYRSMIRSLMYLTASRPAIMFAVCACARFQVTPKTSHLYAIKRIFRYLKGQPKLGLWYPRDSPFYLEAFSNSDYVGASLDRKSTTGGCQFLSKRLISWQCKKQTIVANSTTEAEYVAAVNCCRQVLWIQNQMLDYGFNFMNTKIYIDNEILDYLISEVEFIGLMIAAVLTGMDWSCFLDLEDRMERVTTTASSLEAEQESDTREVQITATIDRKVKLVYEASIRRHLKLEDSDGISTLPNTEIFEQLALMGPKKIAWEQFSSSIATAIIFLATNMSFNFSKMIFEGMGEGLTVPDESHHTPSGVDVRHGGAATTVSSLDAGQGSGNINKTPSMSYDSPLPRVHTLRSDEGKMQHNELMDLVTKLIDRVLVLETDLQQTKKVYSTAFIKLIMKVKKLEKIVKSNKARRRAKIVVSDDEDAAEDSSKHGRKIDEINQDHDISLVQHDAEVQGRHEKKIKFETEDISTAKTLLYIWKSASKDKGEDESSNMAAEEELEQENSKRQKTKESSEPREKEDDELTQEDLQQMVTIVQVEEVYVEALHVKYPIIDWEFYIKESREY
nr:hypothetical protein [Tanacetum cinerariifolium]